MDALSQAILWFLQLHFGSASSLEIIWTTAALVGLGMTLWLTREALRDRAVLTQVRDYIPRGPRDIIARENVRNNIYKVVLQAFFSFLGVVALLSTTPYRTPSLYAIILSLGATAIAVMLAVGAVQDRRDRHDFLRQVRLMSLTRSRRSTDLPPPPPGRRPLS